MLGRRTALAQGMTVACCLCASRVVLGQFTPPSATPIAPIRSVAPACGVNRLKYGSDNAKLRRRTSSGIAEIDSYVPQERRLLDKLFRVTPAFGFFDDGNDPQARTLLAGEASEVLVGVALLAAEKAQHASGWQTAVIGIMAHEWAHAFQYSTRLQEKTFLWETHADYLAGWYLGNKVAMGLANLKIDAFAKSLYERGSSKGYFDPDDYGSPDVRVRAMLAGFDYARRDFVSTRLPDLYSAADEGYVFAAKLRG